VRVLRRRGGVRKGRLGRGQKKRDEEWRELREEGGKGGSGKGQDREEWEGIKRSFKRKGE